MIDQKEFLADLELRLAELDQSIALYEDGTMHLFQGPSASQVSEITAEYIADLKQTKAVYELILSQTLARTNKGPPPREG
jgi:hypothetical protein